VPSRDRGWPGHPPQIRVFAVDDESFQLAWAALPWPAVTFRGAEHEITVECTPPVWHRARMGRRLPPGSGGPGTVVFDGLEPDTDYEVSMSAEGAATTGAVTVRTAPRPPGRLLSRFATISDCHIGEQSFGLAGVLRDPAPRPPDLDPYPIRCAAAALAEAEAWGAETIVVKGDMTDEAEPEEADSAADVLSGATVPVYATLGNHDVRGPVDVAAVLSARGVRAGSDARAVDVPGLRIVLGHSPVPGLHAGRIETGHGDDLVDLAGAAAGPVALVIHHPPQAGPLPTHYPPAVGRRDSLRLMSSLTRANPSSVILAGHTHRNRRYQMAGITVAEVGSTKDYPGQWAGYSVYEGGISQVVRRIGRPDVIAWTDMTKRALGGLWGRWSPGSLTDRCWSLEWPPRR
jgi:Icc protein